MNFITHRTAALFTALFAVLMLTTMPGTGLTEARAASAAANVQTIAWKDLLPAGFCSKAKTPQEAAKCVSENGSKTNSGLDGRVVSITGYVVPLDAASNGGKEDVAAGSEFLLVPFYGACIHVPPPPENQMILVKSEKDPGLRSMDHVAVTGQMQVAFKGDKGADSADAAYVLYAEDFVTQQSESSKAFTRAACIAAVCGLTLAFGMFLTLILKGVKLPARVSQSRLLNAAAAGTLALCFASGALTATGASYLITKNLMNVAWFAAGVLVMLALHFTLHARGKKGSHTCCGNDAGDSCSQDIRRSRFSIALALTIHNIPEAVLVFGAAYQDSRLGLIVAMLIAAHNLPVGAAFGCLIGKTEKIFVVLGYVLMLAVLPAALVVSSFALFDSVTLLASSRSVQCAVGGAITAAALTDIFPRSSVTKDNRIAAAVSFALGFALLLLAFEIGRIVF